MIVGHLVLLTVVCSFLLNINVVGADTITVSVLDDGFIGGCNARCTERSARNSGRPAAGATRASAASVQERWLAWPPTNAAMQNQSPTAGEWKVSEALEGVSLL
jgi:hypothetical protein